MGKKKSNSFMIEEFNRRYALINQSGSAKVLAEVIDPATGFPRVEYSSIQDMKTFYRNQMVPQLDEAGNQKLVNPIDLWLNHAGRRDYKGRIFYPGDGPEGYYNLWRGFAFEPKEGDCNLYLEHILTNICQGKKKIADWVFDWMSDSIQNPTVRPGTAIVLRGRPGTGKGVFISNFGELVQPHFVHVTGQQRLTGRFNALLGQCLLCYADEAFFAGDKRDVGTLKAMVTEKWMTIERKFEDAYQQKNFMRVAMASNSSWVVPADIEERRFLVLDVSDEHMQDNRYFRAIGDQLENGGYEALLFWLLHRKIKSNLRNIPRTQALLDQIVQSLNSVERWWFQALMDGKVIDDDEIWPEGRTTKSVYDSYLAQCSREGERHRLSNLVFARRIFELHPAIERVQRTKLGFRDYYYLFPHLNECRNHFENRVRVSIDWADGE